MAYFEFMQVCTYIHLLEFSDSKCAKN